VNLPAYRGRGSVRRLVFKFLPEKPGNPYSYRREHIRRYCTGYLNPQRYFFVVNNFPGFIFTEGWLALKVLCTVWSGSPATYLNLPGWFYSIMICLSIFYQPGFFLYFSYG